MKQIIPQPLPSHAKGIAKVLYLRFAERNLIVPGIASKPRGLFQFFQRGHCSRRIIIPHGRTQTLKHHRAYRGASFPISADCGHHSVGSDACPRYGVRDDRYVSNLHDEVGCQRSEQLQLSADTCKVALRVVNG